MKNTALITGATSGIGRAYADRFAQEGHNIVVVARSADEVEATCREIIDTHGIQAHGETADLSDIDACRKLKHSLEAAGIEVEYLINNAGFGEQGAFHEIPLERHLKLVHLDVVGMMTLMHLYLESFVQRGHGRILNMASIASFMPGPLLASYHASKAFVLSLSDSVAEELTDNESVSITAVCPGPVDTEFFDRADAEEIKALNFLKVLDPDEVAEGAYKALMDGDRHYIPGTIYKVMVAMRRLQPTGLQAKFNKMFYENDT